MKPSAHRYAQTKGGTVRRNLKAQSRSELKVHTYPQATIIILHLCLVSLFLTLGSTMYLSISLSLTLESTMYLSMYFIHGRDDNGMIIIIPWDDN